MRVLILAIPALILACSTRSLRSEVVPAAQQATVASDLRAFVAFTLAPAAVAPPSVAWDDREVASGPLRARVTPVRPEDAAWNRWSDGSSRLFNNRVAQLFLVRIEGPGPMAWRPRESMLELDGPALRLAAVGGADELLGELTFWALMQERWLLDGDLAARTRAAGPFRDAYLPRTDEAGVLEGLVAFELMDPTHPERVVADEHIVGMRLTLAVETNERVERLVWLFD